MEEDRSGDEGNTDEDDDILDEDGNPVDDELSSESDEAEELEASDDEDLDRDSGGDEQEINEEVLEEEEVEIEMEDENAKEVEDDNEEDSELQYVDENGNPLSAEEIAEFLKEQDAEANEDEEDESEEVEQTEEIEATEEGVGEASDHSQNEEEHDEFEDNSDQAQPETEEVEEGDEEDNIVELEAEETEATEELDDEGAEQPVAEASNSENTSKNDGEAEQIDGDMAAAASVIQIVVTTPSEDVQKDGARPEPKENEAETLSDDSSSESDGEQDKLDTSEELGLDDEQNEQAEGRPGQSAENALLLESVKPSSLAAADLNLKLNLLNPALHRLSAFTPAPSPIPKERLKAQESPVLEKVNITRKGNKFSVSRSPVNERSIMEAVTEAAAEISNTKQKKAKHQRKKEDQENGVSF
eukprot:TRINITY_DN5944_c0_g1_i2.p1 TRINITY_DN5944_c0_g1~~TRINITY_DN5944_c0_g1_i2.p1  ORF type:complete len:415 (-),score=157.91 TRINITY_DN5944_c0_g1_i2:912-2156(-)